MKTGLSIHMLWQIFLWITVLAGPATGPKAYAANPNSNVVISEIMYHPPHAAATPEDTKQEWIELFNRGTETVNLAGWRFSDGVDFVFPNVTLAAGKCLVVAADVGVFKAKHPGVTNVVGGWVGWLRDSGETLTLVDTTGAEVNTIRYTHQGDWGVRELGPASSGHRGWQWSAVSEGDGKSLELINSALPNDLGQNWAASLANGGTPGAANSVAASNTAPMILDAAHQPIIPRSTDQVTVAARILDEQTTGLTVTLRYRLDTSTYVNTSSYPVFNAASYLSAPMADDGTHGDGQAGDGIFGGVIPAQADKRIVEFYLEAKDAAGKTRTWPAPSMVDGVAQQVTNALYQVDNSFNPTWVPGSRPGYYIIMTEMECGRLAYIGSHSSLSGPDSQMNATFISVDGTGMQLRYNTGARNRGHGTRNGPPNNQHICFTDDHPWNGRSAISFNVRNTHEQVMGSAIFRMAGLPAAYNTPVQLRINGTNLASTGSPMFGVYGRLDAVDSFLAKQQFPSDPDGNLYECFRDNGEADLRYLGTNPNSYRPSYFKATNASQDDWSDLIHLVDVLNNASEATYFEDVSKVINVPQWLRYVALDSLLTNNETGLNMGIGDDYFMYRGVIDPRFMLFPHDLDTILDAGGSVNTSIFSVVQGVSGYNGVDGLKRFFSNPEVIGRYYQAMLDLLGDFFNSQTLDPLIDRVVGGFAPADRVNAMKQRVRQRSAAVLAQIPQSLTVDGTPVAGLGYFRAGNSTIDLSGKAHAGKTRSVLVNGRPAVWSPLTASWALARIPVKFGINRVVIQALDAAGQEIDRCSVDVWCDVVTIGTKAGTLSADEVWTVADSPYHVTGNIIVPAGRTLTIEPGASVLLDANCGFIVHGRLVAQGTEYQRIQFTRMLGSSMPWAGFQFPDTKEDNVIAYADLVSGGARSEWITTGNNNGSVVGPTARLTIDHATFSGSDTQYFNLWDPQIIIRNSVFADLGTHYMGKAERMPADGWFLIEGNLFGHTHGDTDILHLNGVSVKGGPVAQITDNVFAGGGDNLVANNETDAYIEGNLFMRANVGNTARSASAAVTTGPGGGSAHTPNLNTQQLTVVRNTFYHNDYGILCETGASAQIMGNVFVQNAGAILFNETTRTDSGPGRAVYVDSCIFWNSGPEVNGTAADNGTGTFVNRQNTQVVVNNSLVGSQFVNLGTGNIAADPILVDAARDVHVDANLPRFSTGFPGFAARGYLLQGMIPDVPLRPESAARGSGCNGVDMGATVPAGASISGEPPQGVTWRTDVTLTVGGPDLLAYKYRVNNGPWSAEIVRPEAATSIIPRPLPPIVLTNLQNRQFYTVSVLGQDATGLWQSEANPTVSRTWSVNTSYKGLVINEVLAVNQAAVKRGSAFPDLVELYYDGSAALSLSGMSLTDDPCVPTQFVFPADATINPGQYLVLYADSGASGDGLHLGFGLNAEGDAVYLYDRTGTLIDSVIFGQQLPDLSIGRVGPQGQWHLTIPTFGQANIACPLGDSRTIKINEWLAGSEVLFASDFIELYNPQPDPVDLGGMCLTDHPITEPRRHAIRPLSFIDGHGFGVFWADDSNDPGFVNFRLSVDGEILGLLDAQAREVDKVFYPPQTTDFSEGRVPDSSTTLAIPPLPTPGMANPQRPKAATTAGVLVEEKATKKVLVPTAAISDDWKGGKTFNDSSWLTCAGAPGGVGMERSTGYETYFSLDVGNEMYGKNASCYIRIPFTVAGDPAAFKTMTLKVRYDDGFVAYLNGTEIARAFFTGTPAWKSAANANHDDAASVILEAFDVSAKLNLLQKGQNILAIHGMNSSTTSSDFLISAVLETVAAQGGGQSSLERALKLLDGLRITELMYRSPKGGSYDYVELQNTLGEVLDVNGVRFDKGVDFTFPPLTLQPGEYVVVAADVAAFRSVYGTTPKVVGPYKGNLSDTGEKIVLLLPAPYDAALLRFEYNNTWYPTTDGGGKSLTIQDPLAPPGAWKEAESWRAADPTPGG